MALLFTIQQISESFKRPMPTMYNALIMECKLLQRVVLDSSDCHISYRERCEKWGGEDMFA